MGRRKESPGSLFNVAVLAAIRHPLTYRVPPSEDVRPGQRVLVPVGGRRALGVALEPVARIPPGVKARDILRVLDPEPLLSPELLVLGDWIQEYYLAPPGEVFSAMLPLRSETRRDHVLEITPQGRHRLEELKNSLLDEIRTGVEERFLSFVAAHPETTSKSLRGKLADSALILSEAVEKGWIKISSVERERGRRKTWAVRLAEGASEALPQGPLPTATRRLSPVARRVLEALRNRGAFEDHRQLLKSSRASLAHLRRLSEAGLVALEDAPRSLTPANSVPPAPPELTAAQETIFQELAGRLEKRQFSTVLLHGVTASGKTEIYLRLIARCLEQGRTALVLVPEIALTPAAQAQFLDRFGDRVAVLHSGLTESERHDEWWRTRRGEAKAVLGTRSAVFAPVDDLGLVIVDEEHDPSYKQEETPRYHGRDVAIVRARLAGALAVLGSATPSLESYWNARQGKYHLSVIEERVGGRPLAKVEIIDMRQEFRETQSEVAISRRLRQEIEAQLSSRTQTMILLNRRGYSWFLLCRSCGETERCRNCSISLTYHRREHRLICHYCGYSAGVPARCSTCGSEYLHYVGEGTEKLERKLAELFPGARVARLDRDVAQRAGQYRKILWDLRDGRIDILVGTQLIAKGHDFPGVTLVAAVSADLGLRLPDFRAAERTFQLLTQAAGRAGRGDLPGRVLIQTFYPEHYAIRLAAEQNYREFFDREIKFRRALHYPPCVALANLLVVDPKLERAAQVAAEIGRYLYGRDGGLEGVKVLGPNPAPLAKIKGKYRLQFLLKAASRARLNALLRSLLVECDRRGVPLRSLVIDVDPVSVM